MSGSQQSMSYPVYPNRCRVCLEKSPKFYALNGPVPNVETTISTMIEYCTSLDVEISERLPQGVCIPCFRTVRIAYNFINQYKETHQKLLEELVKCESVEDVVDNEQLLEELVKCEQAENNPPIEEVNLKTPPADQSDEESEEETREIPTENDDMEYVTESPNMTFELVTDSPNVKVTRNQSSFVLEEFETPFSASDLIGERIMIITENEAASEQQAIKERQKKTSKSVLRRRLHAHFVCPKCPEQLYGAFEKGYMNHIVSEHSDEMFDCNMCEEKNMTVDSFLKHFVHIHRYQCPLCGKSFNKLASKNAHLRVHSDIRYRCTFDKCTKSFMTPWALRKHQNIHTRVAKFVCHDCGYQSCSYDNYRYHLKKHNGPMHLCPHCGQSFIMAVHLKYHMWKHTGDKYFKCKQCPKSYTSSSQLKKHRQRHHGLK